MIPVWACACVASALAVILTLLTQLPSGWPAVSGGGPDFPRPRATQQGRAAAAAEKGKRPLHCDFWETGGISRQVSRQSCVGDMDSEKAETYDRSCHFQSVCFNRSSRGFVFFRGEGPPARMGTDIRWGDVYGLLPKAVHLRNLPPNQNAIGETQFFLSMEYRAGEIPATATWSEVPYHVLYQPFWPENFAHAFFDDILPVIRLLDRFDALPCAGRQLKVWLNTPCDHLYKQNPAWAERACRFVEYGSRVLSDEPAEVLGRGDMDRQELYCVENLFAGSNGLGMQYRPAGHYLRFVSQLLEVSGSDRILPTGQHIVFVHKEEGGRGPGPPNMLGIAETTRARFEGVARVSVASPHQMSFKEQFGMARSATVVVTPCGGISFFAAFMSPSTTRIIIDYWDFRHDASTKNDPYIWQWDPLVRTLHYRIERADVTTPPDATGGKTSPVLLDFGRLRPLIEDGLAWARLGYAGRWPRPP